VFNKLIIDSVSVYVQSVFCKTVHVLVYAVVTKVACLECSSAARNVDGFIMKGSGGRGVVGGRTVKLCTPTLI
jgi:hypothetical protein